MANPFVGLGIEDAKASVQREPLIACGEYLLEVVENKVIEDKKKKKILLRTFRVLEAVGEGASAVGSLVKAKLLYLDDEWAGARIAEYVRALTNAKVVDPDIAFKIFGDANPAAGKQLRARVYKHPNAAGKDYDRYDFSYVADDEAK